MDDVAAPPAGDALFSQYSLLHFAMGLIIFFTKVPLLLATLAYTAFLLVHHSEEGSRFMSKFVPMWPGGKRSEDYLPILGDILAFDAGWLAASAADCWHDTSPDRHLFQPHNGSGLSSDAQK
jgi:hypothetical protein